MLLCAAGDIHGAMDRMYDDVLALERVLGKRFDWVLHVGDFGVWPDPSRIDRAARKHDGAGDFPDWLGNRRAAPRRTVFIKGNHEDFLWLDAQPSPEVLPGLFYLRNGQALSLGESDDSVWIGGVGGCYGPSDFGRPSKSLQGYAKRHYTSDEIDALCVSPRVDVLLVHDAPAGIRFETYQGRRDGVSEAAGLDRLIHRLRPLVCFFGHHHTRVDGEIAGVRCIGLNKVGMPGNLVAVEIDAGRREWSVIAEWPDRHRSRGNDAKL